MNNNKIRELIINHFHQSGFEVIFRAENKSLWNKTLEKTSYIPCNYLNYSAEYEYEYQRIFFEECFDISFIVKKNNSLISVWPLLITKKYYNIYNITSYDNTIYPPLTSKNLSIKQKKEFIKLCIKFIEFLSNNLKLKEWRTVDSFINEIGISLWHQYIIEKNTSLNLKYDLLLNLNKDFDLIKKNFRKSSKSLINRGTKIWKSNVMKKFNKDKWEEFKNLHLKVSGRKTRSDKTWEIHEKQIKEKEGFLIYLENKKNEIVGGGFFCFSKYECSYRAGVYSRDLFDKPLGHTVQSIAIKEMKKLNLPWYNIGPNYYDFYDPRPNEKEISISYFKKGFSSHILAKYEFKIQNNGK